MQTVAKLIVNSIVNGYFAWSKYFGIKLLAIILAEISQHIMFQSIIT